MKPNITMTMITSTQNVYKETLLKSLCKLYRKKEKTIFTIVLSTNDNESLSHILLHMYYR